MIISSETEHGTWQQWLEEKFFLGRPFGQYLQGLITPFNCAAGVIVAAGAYLLLLRFTQGLAAVSSASDVQPWSLFLTWGLFAGVPLSATGFLLTTAVHIFGMDSYRPVVRNAILVGFLGYFFAVVFLLIDLGRPWRIYFPMAISFGPASVMFLVAWHVALYLSCQAIEFSPSAFEWLQMRRWHRWALSITLGLTIGGVVLSTLHQSALGAMFLLMPGKLHPLWYSPYIPWLFFISSIAAGLSMMIVVGILTRRFCLQQADAAYLDSLDRIAMGLGKGSALALFAYLGLKLVALAHGDHWGLLATPWGLWYLVELVGFVVLPGALFVVAVRDERLRLVHLAAAWTLAGVILNRFNVSLLALNWRFSGRELINWKEAVIILAVVTIEVLVYRWIVTRMSVLRAPSA